MKFPNLPFSKKEKSEFFLSLIFETDKLEAHIFEKIGNTMRPVVSTEEPFSETLETAGFEEILDVADKVITQTEDEAKLGDEVNKTIFGLKDSWVTDNKIKKENLEILKKLCDSLGLTPVGFLTIPEAVVSLLQKEEGAPPSVILVDVSKNQIGLSLVKAGKVIESKTSEIHQSPVFTVDTLLKHFETMEILPSRVILLNEDEDLVQEFLNHQWSKSLPFLHLPQTTNLPAGFLGRAFVLGVAKQFNADIVEEKEPIREKEAEEIQSIEQEEEPIQKDEIEHKSKVEELENATEFFGFSNKDVAKAELVKPPKEVLPTEKEQEVTEEIPEEIKIKEEGKHILPASVLMVLPKIKSVFEKAKSKAQSSNVKLPQNIPQIPFGGKKLLVIGIPLILILLVIFYYFTGLKAVVVLSVKPNIVEKTQDITFSNSSDFGKNIIKGDPISQDEDGSITVPATGSKDTGDLAKGTVTIFNLTSDTVTYPAKTTIISSNSLNFNLDSTVTVASSSGDASNRIPGKVNVNVTAGKFGTEYNMPSGTKFTIGNVSAESIVAKNDNPFSGGTKKTLTVVSKNDISNAETSLEKQLEDKAKRDISSKLTGGAQMLSVFTNETMSKESTDKKIDDEAKNLTITGTVTYTTISYGKAEFKNFLKNILGSNVSLENIQLSFSNVKTKGTDTTATVDIKAKSFPQMDLGKLADQIKGKPFSFANNILSNISQVSSVQIKFSPNIPFLPKNLPRTPKNIIFHILDNG